MGLTIRKVRDEGKTAENFYSHMTAIQNLYDEARRENCMKNSGCEAELEKTKHELQETKKKLQIAEKKYDDLMKEIRNMFSFVKEKDSSDEGMTEEVDFLADNEEEDDDFQTKYEDDEAEWV